MKITVTTDLSMSTVVVLEVSSEMEMENFLALCQIEVPSLANAPLRSFVVSCNGHVVHMSSENLKKNFNDLNIHDGDVVLVNSRAKVPRLSSGPASSQSASSKSTAQAQLIANLVNSIRVPPPSSAGPSASTPRGGLTAMERAQLRQLFDGLKESEERRDRLRGVIPTLVEAAQKGDFEGFCTNYVKDRERAVQQQRAMLDPLNPEGQRLIAEQIERENIDFSHQFALEHMPEAYIPVSMLYIRLKINGIDAKAFIDSGAQVSILSERLATRCGLMRLVDKRFQATAHGVGGTQQFIGKIHTCQVQIEDKFFPCNFDILGGDRDVDVLLGLDILKRHQCVIDLKNNCLRFGDSTVTPFLSDAEVPKREYERSGSSTGQQSANRNDRWSKR